MTLVGLAGRRSGGGVVERAHSRLALDHLLERCDKEIAQTEMQLATARHALTKSHKERRRILRWQMEIDR